MGIWGIILNLWDQNFKIFKILNACDKIPRPEKQSLYLEKTLYLKNFLFLKKSLNLKTPNPQYTNSQI